MLGPVPTAIAELVQRVFPHLDVDVCRYDEAFDALWESIGQDGRECAPEKVDVRIVYADSGTTRERGTRAIDWAMTSMIDSAAHPAAGPAGKTILVQPPSGSPDGAAGLATVVLESVPEFAMIRSPIDLGLLFKAILSRESAGPGIDAASYALLRLGELAGPHDRHHLSNLLAPLLMIEGLVRPDSDADLDVGTRAACRSLVVAGEVGRNVRAIARQINLCYNVLGLQPPFPDFVFESVPEIKTAPTPSGRAPKVWQSGLISAGSPTGILLVDDGAALGYGPILQALFIGSISDPSKGFRHAVNTDFGDITFDAATSLKEVRLEEKEHSIVNGCSKLQPPLQVVFRNQHFDLLILDLRLLETDQSVAKMEDISGVQFARHLTSLDPSMPVMFFSSTQQQWLYRSFRNSRNFVTTFKKPAFTGYSETLDAREAADLLLEAARESTHLLRVRFLYEWLYELSAEFDSQKPCEETFTFYKLTSKGRAKSSFSVEIAETVVSDDLLAIFCEQLQRGLFPETILSCYQVMEACFSHDFNIHRWHNACEGLAAKRQKVFKVTLELLDYLVRCRNCVAHGEFRRHPPNVDLDMEAICAMAATIACCDILVHHLGTGRGRVNPAVVLGKDYADEIADLAQANLEALHGFSAVRQELPTVVRQTFVRQAKHQIRVVSCRTVPHAIRLAIARAGAALRIWKNFSAERNSILARSELLWLKLLRADAERLKL